jgi:D-3-phosphoglycerate dehydrogenase
VYKNTIGIIGLGRVGKIIAKYYSAFEATVYYYDIEDIDFNHAIKCDSIETLIEKSRVIILCANYTPENEKMIGFSQLYLMKDKYFINAARGELINETDFLRLIEKKWFKGVAIDVITSETKESAFLKELLSLTAEQNIIITPHIGGATFSSMERTEEYVAEKLVNAIAHTLED